MEKIYLYDFDKTIYAGDSSIDFFKFCLRKNIKISKHLPKIVFCFILKKLKILKIKEFKEQFFSFLKDINDIDEYVELFWEKNKNRIYDFFNNELNINSRITNYIISASPYFLLYGYTKKLKNVYLIATNMNKHTGKINGENCKGKEKVNKLPQDIYIEKFYSDSYSDRFLANIAENAYICWNGKIFPWSRIRFIKRKIIKLFFVILMLLIVLSLIFII